MKNKEKYLDEILNMFVSGDYICEFKIKYVLETLNCREKSCAECSERTREWLEEEYKKSITEDEKIILKNLKPNLKWLVRNADGQLCVYVTYPAKNLKGSWVSKEDPYILDSFNHLFSFIQCEDKEPYSIEELLRESEAEE